MMVMLIVIAIVIVIVISTLMLVRGILLMAVANMQVQRSETRDDISFSAGQEPVGDRKGSGTTCEIYH